jgi:hypothetical protein
MGVENCRYCTRITDIVEIVADRKHGDTEYPISVFLLIL